jgi:alkanesulfonate monooxygenase SsuD/methylene tetrahydromethanopterin reductase-like flavin-dependent oxidoreductase (luciferase family)
MHVPIAHPVMVAKTAATADHISGGRLGLNIVAGWHNEELAIFGLDEREHDERYDVADEWAEVLKQLWTVEGERLAEAGVRSVADTQRQAARMRSA